MKRHARVALLVSLLAGAGCGRDDEPTRFIPPSADAPISAPSGRNRGPAAERAPDRNIEMH